MASDVTSFRFLSGRLGYGFDQTAVNGTEPIFLKVGDDSAKTFHVEYIQLACGSGALVSLFDGSAGTAIINTMQCSSGTTYSQSWDFRDDPILVLKDSTGSLCISASANGIVQGVVKGYWG